MHFFLSEFCLDDLFSVAVEHTEGIFPVFALNSPCEKIGLIRLIRRIFKVFFLAGTFYFQPLYVPVGVIIVIFNGYAL